MRKEAGDELGLGFIKLIKQIQNNGLIVWTEGVSDIYLANYLQMNQFGKQLRLWPDGQVRQGMPLGQYDPEFFTAIHGNRGDITYPLGKSHDREQFSRTGATIIEVNADNDNPFFREPGQNDIGFLEITRQKLMRYREFAHKSL